MSHASNISCSSSPSVVKLWQMAHLPTSTVTICWCYPTVHALLFLMQMWIYFTILAPNKQTHLNYWLLQMRLTFFFNLFFNLAVYHICYTIVQCFLFSEMTCCAPLKCWAACQVHTQALSTATIRSLFFFLRVLEGVSAEQKLSDDKQNRGWCCCHGLAVNAPGLTAGARREGTENAEAKRSGERVEWKTVNPVTLLNRTFFFSLCEPIYLYTNKSAVLQSRCSDRELWNDLSLPPSWRIWALTAVAQGST